MQILPKARENGEKKNKGGKYLFAKSAIKGRARARRKKTKARAAIQYIVNLFPLKVDRILSYAFTETKARQRAGDTKAGATSRARDRGDDNRNPDMTRDGQIWPDMTRDDQR